MGSPRGLRSGSCGFVRFHCPPGPSGFVCCSEPRDNANQSPLTKREERSNAAVLGDWRSPRLPCLPGWHFYRLRQGGIHHPSGAGSWVCSVSNTLSCPVLACQSEKGGVGRQGREGADLLFFTWRSSWWGPCIRPPNAESSPSPTAWPPHCT